MSEAQNLIESAIASWGTWTVVSGNLLALGIYAWRTVKPEVWDGLHPRLKRVIPPTVAALATVSGTLIAGASWAEAGQTLIATWGGALITQDVLTGLVKPQVHVRAPMSSDVQLSREEHVDDALKRRRI